MSRRLLLAAVVLASAWACRREVKPPPESVPLDPAALEPMIASNRDAALSVRRYQALIRIRGKGPEGGFSGRLVVIFERPERLRIELLGALSGTRWSAVVDDAGIRVVFPGPEQYLEEADAADIVGRLLGLRLRPDEVMALLSGAGAPLDATVERAFSRGDAKVALLESGASVTLDESEQVIAVSGTHYRVEYPSPWKARRRQVPDTLVLESERLRATLNVEAVDVNVALDPDAFELAVPAGAARLLPADVDGEAVFVVSPPER